VGRPKGSKNQTQTSSGPSVWERLSGTPQKEIPQDEDAFEAALKPHRLPARMCVGMVNSVVKALDMQPADKDELEALERAYALMLYQTGITMLDWRFAIATSHAAFLGPRVAKKVAERRRKKQAVKDSQAVTGGAVMRVVRDAKSPTVDVIRDAKNATVEGEVVPKTEEVS
jgi:hypothetical protein